MRRRYGLSAGVLALAAVSSVGVLVATRLARSPLEVASVPPPRAEVDAGQTDAAAEPSEDEQALIFHVPSGQPASLTCDEARRILAQVHGSLAYVPHPVAPQPFGASTSDWLDPNGLWSVAPDSPVPAALDREAPALLHELTSDAATPCLAARHVGAVLARWTEELTVRFDEARLRARHARAAPAGADEEAADALFDDEGARGADLATAIGGHGGDLERAMGDAVTPYVEAARARFFPPLDVEGWAGVVRAAAVRAYVQTVDPHGAWAPVDEEASVYDVDLEARPPDRLWDDAARTAVGVRVDRSPMAPLEVGDVVLSIAGVTTVGLPVEQLDQLVYATTDAPASAALVVLRAGEHAPRTLELPAPDEEREGEAAPASLPSYRVPYDGGEALVVEIHDIVSDLGDQLRAVLHEESSTSPSPVALLLDLRADGGGSTEGAIAALGLLLPGAPLFPMETRDGSIEVDRAPDPPLEARWTRPVAALVDRDTASAAEMIAGALMAYRRGPVVGERTYGKGCAQEYLDDESGQGVLRLTTLLYALPDGTPVQGVGLEPSILLPEGSAASSPRQSESDDPNAPPTWRGPDVRDRVPSFPASFTVWPEHHGAVGPCSDADVCRALRSLGNPTTVRGPTALGPAGGPLPHR